MRSLQIFKAVPFSIIFPILIMISGCKALLEDNLKNTKPVLTSPTADTLSSNSITFAWEEIKGANYYNLQVVKGSFNNIQAFEIDTNVGNLYFMTSLLPGNYSCRIRGVNSSSKSEFTTKTFTILQSDSISTQTLILKSPPSNAALNTGTVTFKWYPIPAATGYTFELRSTAGDVLLSQNIQEDSIVITGIQPGQISWNVRAYNNSSATAFATRNLFIDTSAPSLPTIIDPLPYDTVVLPYNFSWTRPTDNGTPITDSLFIYSDSLITLANFYTTSSLTVSVTGLSPKWYFARVRGVDAAGNSGSFGSPIKFRVK